MTTHLTAYTYIY